MCGSGATVAHSTGRWSGLRCRYIFLFDKKDDSEQLKQIVAKCKFSFWVLPERRDAGGQRMVAGEVKRAHQHAVCDGLN